MNRALLQSSLLLLLGCAAPMVLADGKKDNNPFEMTKEEQGLFDLLNKERAHKDLPALRPNPLLFQAARRHSANMAKQRKMEHLLDGKRPCSRAAAAIPGRTETRFHRTARRREPMATNRICKSR